MNARFCLVAASISGAIAVMMGAFTAHALKDTLSSKLMAVMQTGVQYQFYHSLALLLVGLLLQQRPTALLKVSAASFLAGIVLFCGSLYLLAFSGVHGIGIVTPIGGLAFIAGWLILARNFITLDKR
ncbi:DUF423 domain-containing protein [Neptunomonas japonica]|uniref:DUF423 domain-containing protein n=1 Tax=Neptunomonas japonica JAMM 1380 TaxID=1441457 RepID=A0A7R6PKK3_9GAMM|nr:DUF423 domain-containing protein [Neptunomonas japonica]BBB28167.1 conserved hypothetical protein [Neptunomonas japonica JAMM 1380]